VFFLSWVNLAERVRFELTEHNKTLDTLAGC
jgi:hypothetical protein